MADVTNYRRAMWGKKALVAFAEATGMTNKKGELVEDWRTVAGDLITDILHFMRLESDDEDGKMPREDMADWLSGRLELHDDEAAEDPDYDDDHATKKGG